MPIIIEKSPILRNKNPPRGGGELFGILWEIFRKIGPFGMRRVQNLDQRADRHPVPTTARTGALALVQCGGVNSTDARHVRTRYLVRRRQIVNRRPKHRIIYHIRPYFYKNGYMS